MEIDEKMVAIIFQKIHSRLDTPLEVIGSTLAESISFASELSSIMANTFLKQFPPGFVEDFSRLLQDSQKKDSLLTSSLIVQFLIHLGSIIANLTPNVPSPTIVVAQKQSIISAKLQIAFESQDSLGISQAKQMMELVKLFPQLKREISDLQKNKKVLISDVEALLTHILTLYEGFRPVCGLLLGLFDIIHGTSLEKNRVVEYFKSDLNPKADFYLTGKVGSCTALKTYFQNSPYPAIKHTLQIIFGKIHYWRIHTAHHRADVIQDRLGDGIYHVYTKSGLKDVNVEDIDTTLQDFIWLFLLIALQAGALYFIAESH